MPGGPGGHRVRVAEPDVQHDGTRPGRQHVPSGTNAAAEYAAASPGRHNADACTDHADACTDHADANADPDPDPDPDAVRHAQHDGDGHVQPHR